MTYLAHRLAATALRALRQCPIWSLPAIHVQGAVVSALNRAARQAVRYLLADHLNICLLLQTADIPDIPTAKILENIDLSAMSVVKIPSGGKKEVLHCHPQDALTRPP